MKKILLTFTVLLVAVLVAGCGAKNTPNTGTEALINNQTPTSDNTAEPSTTNQEATQPSATPAVTPTKVAPQTVAVSIQNFSFNPKSLTIQHGDTVVWTNDDPAPHSIKGDGFNSPTLNTGNTFSFQFNNPGIVKYNCGIHPSMSGEIIVQ